MTNKKVIKLIIFLKTVIVNEEITEALKIAEEAINKQIPRHPIRGCDCGCSIRSCPTCNAKLYDSDWDLKTQEKYHQIFCLNCGQRLSNLSHYLGEWEED